MNTVNTRKRYPKAFKEEAVRLSYSSGKTVAQQATISASPRTNCMPGDGRRVIEGRRRFLATAEHVTPN